jgi:hypothetical protein
MKSLKGLFFMRRLKFLTLFAAIFIILAPAIALHAEEADPAAPAAVLPEPGYVFDSVPEGIDVLHDYPIRNTGTATLNIEKVKTG